VQNLAYDYDMRRDLTSRTDMLQTQYTTERFRYDPLERLTCAYFSVTENDTAPCGVSYGYAPSGNGNLTTKSDVGTLVYGDPQHPHAVTSAGTNSYGYDAVGNQTARPNGATVSYTPFNLPSTITQSTGTVTLAYDGDQQRIRKTTPTAETLYFSDLFEQVTTVAPASTAYQYYVHSPERVDGTPAARLGLAVGQTVGGIFGVVGGLAGEVAGGLASSTGIGALVGVPAIAVSTVVVTGSFANIGAGLHGLAEALQSSGSGGGSVGAPPQRAVDTATHAAANNGAARPGYAGGRTFSNDGRGGGQVLPRQDASGRPITYREYDVNPRTPGVNRGGERVVIGSDGSRYWTDDHYTTFTSF
jgi:YD repeat-containing protein